MQRISPRLELVRRPHGMLRNLGSNGLNTLIYISKMYNSFIFRNNFFTGFLFTEKKEYYRCLLAK